MVSAYAVGEAFTLFLVSIAYLPVVRAHAVERDSPWLVAAFTALLVGRIAAVADGPVGLAVAPSPVVPLIEHGVGIALAAVLFTGHFNRERRADEDRSRTDQTNVSTARGDD